MHLKQNYRLGWKKTGNPKRRPTQTSKRKLRKESFRKKAEVIPKDCKQKLNDRPFFNEVSSAIPGTSRRKRGSLKMGRSLRFGCLLPVSIDSRSFSPQTAVIRPWQTRVDTPVSTRLGHTSSLQAGVCKTCSYKTAGPRKTAGLRKTLYFLLNCVSVLIGLGVSSVLKRISKSH